MTNSNQTELFPTIKKSTSLQEDILANLSPSQVEKKGEKDPRHLWPEYFRLIQELRPDWIIGENVSGHIKLGLDTVLQNLESESYTTRTFSISASSVGANHQRERIFVVANSMEHSERDGLTEPKKRGGSEETVPEESKGENNAFNIEGTSGIPTTSTNVADSIEGNAQAGRERRRTVREVGRGEGVSSDASGGGEIGGTRDMANASREGSQGSGVESDVEGETIQESAARSGQEGIFSNTERIGQQGQGKPVRPGDPEEDCEGETDRLVDESEGAQGWWDIEPDVGRVAHGVPKRVDRLKCLGNSLIPHIPYYIGCSILESYFLEDTDGGG